MCVLRMQHIRPQNKCLRRCIALPAQVRNGQLDKEAGELRDENAQLQRECETLRSDAASGARVRSHPSLLA